MQSADKSKGLNVWIFWVCFLFQLLEAVVNGWNNPSLFIMPNEKNVINI